MLFPSLLSDVFFDEPVRGSKDLMNMMTTDVKEKGDNYEITVDLPGFKKEDVQVQLDKGCLTINATRKQETNEEDGKYIRRERFSGSCSRSFRIADNITQEQIHAKFENGILTLDVPKQGPQQIEANKNIAIE